MKIRIAGISFASLICGAIAWHFHTSSTHIGVVTGGVALMCVLLILWHNPPANEDIGFALFLLCSLVLFLGGSLMAATNGNLQQSSPWTYASMGLGAIAALVVNAFHVRKLKRIDKRRKHLSTIGRSW